MQKSLSRIKKLSKYSRTYQEDVRKIINETSLGEKTNPNQVHFIIYGRKRKWSERVQKVSDALRITFKFLNFV